jgi:hypothetical protein
MNPKRKIRNGSFHSVGGKKYPRIKAIIKIKDGKKDAKPTQNRFLQLLASKTPLHFANKYTSMRMRSKKNG